MNGLDREQRGQAAPIAPGRVDIPRSPGIALVPGGGPRLGSRTSPAGPVWDLRTALQPELEALVDARAEQVGGAALEVLRRGAGRVIIGVRHRVPLEGTVVEAGDRFLEAVRDAAPERQGQAILLEACAWRVGRPAEGPWQVIAEVSILCLALEQLAETDPEMIAPALDRLDARLAGGQGTVRLPASAAPDVERAQAAMLAAHVRLGRPLPAIAGRRRQDRPAGLVR